MHHLTVQSIVICSPLGNTSQAATAAMRAGFNNFRRSDQFFDLAGEPLILSAIPELAEEEIDQRFALMFASVFQQCQATVAQFKAEKCGIILLLPENSRPGLTTDFSKKFAQQIVANYHFHKSALCLPLGKHALVRALPFVVDIFTNNEDVDHVFMVGIDSYINEATIDHYLQQNRLLSDGNSDGFIPGEGAAGLIFSRKIGAAGLNIIGCGRAEEAAHILQDKLVNQGKGLSNAIKAAAKDAGCAVSDCHFHCSAVSGEDFYFEESTTAISRSLEKVLPSFSHRLIAGLIGETGAAGAPMILCYLAAIMQHRYRPGNRALVHLSDDSSSRSALIVEWKS